MRMCLKLCKLLMFRGPKNWRGANEFSEVLSSTSRDSNYIWTCRDTALDKSLTTVEQAIVLN